MKVRWAAGAPPWTVRPEAVIADKFGFFRDAGIETTEIVVLREEGEAVQALLAGKVDIIRDQSRRAMIAHAQGAPIRLIGMPDNKLIVGLAVDPAIGDPKNLEGKTVAVGIFGGVVERLARMSLRLLGVDPEKVNCVDGATGSVRLERLNRGEIQAAIMLNVNLVAARTAGFVIHETLSDRYPTYAFHALSTSQRLLDEQPELVVSALEGALRGMSVLVDPARVNDIAPLFLPQLPGGSGTTFGSSWRPKSKP